MNLEHIAKLGTNGDDTLAHLDTGEVVVPKSLTKRPEVQNILAQLFAGVGKPLGEFQVGGEDDKINPITGIRGFWDNDSEADFGGGTDHGDPSTNENAGENYDEYGDPIGTYDSITGRSTGINNDPNAVSDSAAQGGGLTGFSSRKGDGVYSRDELNNWDPESRGGRQPPSYSAEQYSEAAATAASIAADEKETADLQAELDAYANNPAANLDGTVNVPGLDFYTPDDPNNPFGPNAPGGRSGQYDDFYSFMNSPAGMGLLTAASSTGPIGALGALGAGLFSEIAIGKNPLDTLVDDIKGFVNDPFAGAKNAVNNGSFPSSFQFGGGRPSSNSFTNNIGLGPSVSGPSTSNSFERGGGGDGDRERNNDASNVALGSSTPRIPTPIQPTTQPTIPAPNFTKPQEFSSLFGDLFGKGSFSIDDNIINQIVQERQSNISGQVANLSARGNLSSTGTQSANKFLQDQVPSATNRVNQVAQGVLGNYDRDFGQLLGGAETQYNENPSAFDTGAFSNQVNDFFTARSGAFSNDLRTSLGSEALFDFPGALDAGGRAQGQVSGAPPTGQSPLLSSLAQRNTRNSPRNSGSSGSGAF